MKELKNKNAILTGGSRGLGLMIAQKLAHAGVNLALAARSEKLLENASAELSASGVNVLPMRVDVNKKSDLERLVAETEKQLGSIDILINNAGIELLFPFSRVPYEKIEQIISTNLTAPMMLTRMILPGMIARGKRSYCYDFIFCR